MKNCRQELAFPPSLSSIFLRRLFRVATASSYCVFIVYELLLENLIGDTVTHVTVDIITPICIQAACGQALGCAGGSKGVWPVGFVWAGTQGRTGYYASCTNSRTELPKLKFGNLEIGNRKLEIGNRKSEIGNRKSEIGNRKSEKTT